MGIRVELTQSEHEILRIEKDCGQGSNTAKPTVGARARFQENARRPIEGEHGVKLASQTGRFWGIPVT